MATVRLFSGAIAFALSAAVLGAGMHDARAAESPEPPVGKPGPEGDYLRLIHDLLHPGWVDGFIRISPYQQLGPASSERLTEISITIRWDGTVENAAVTGSSGSLDYDAAALNSIWAGAPFPPPVDVLADDGLAHLKWRFARNYRLCSGGEFVHVEFPLQAALPNLTSRGKLGEALRRMNDELSRVGFSNGDFVSPFVRQWLSRPNLSNQLDTRAAAALAVAGDRHYVKILQTALVSPETAAIAAEALARLGVDVGNQLAQTLAGEAAESKHVAVVAAIRAAPAAAVGCPGCIATLAAAALDPRQPQAARVEMIEILSRMDGTPIIAQALAHAAKDSNPAIRGAAILAQMPPGRGRVGVIRMAALLHDPAPEIRAAAAAGVLRAGGDLGIEQLYLLARERDARPPIAAAAELGRMSSEASAQLLGKLLKRSEKPVRIAVIRALAGRHDLAARNLVDPILAAALVNPAEISEVRETAIAAAVPGQLVGLSVDPRLGLAAYRALLRANLRKDAARWLFSNLERLSAEDRITVLGDWIAEPPKYAAQQ
jgi:hypothetical protein